MNGRAIEASNVASEITAIAQYVREHAARASSSEDVNSRYTHIGWQHRMRRCILWVSACLKSTNDETLVSQALSLHKAFVIVNNSADTWQNKELREAFLDELYKSYVALKIFLTGHL
jgi:hypothetical protein